MLDARVVRSYHHPWNVASRFPPLEFGHGKALRKIKEDGSLSNKNNGVAARRRLHKNAGL
jgi:hypothetical protein